MTIVAASTTAHVGVYLGIYATTVSTLAGAWALYAGLFRDRARITVHPYEAYLVNTSTGQMVVRGEDTLQMMGVREHQRRPILELVVQNRGRRAANVKKISQRRRWHGSWLFGDLAGQVPFTLGADDSKTVVLGANGGYAHGDISTRRFYAVDGAARIHPLRERWKQRLMYAICGWAVAFYFKRKRRRLREIGK